MYCFTAKVSADGFYELSLRFFYSTVPLSSTTERCLLKSSGTRSTNKYLENSKMPFAISRVLEYIFSIGIATIVHPQLSILLYCSSMQCLLSNTSITLAVMPLRLLYHCKHGSKDTKASFLQYIQNARVVIYNCYDGLHKFLT